MKKIILLSIICIIVLAGCNKEAVYSEEKLIPDDQLQNIYVTPEDYIGMSINLNVGLDSTPTYDENVGAYQSFGYTDLEQNNYVSLAFSQEIMDENDLQEYDYLIIQGVVVKALENDGKIYPRVEVTSVQEVTYDEAFDPAISTTEINETVSQNGVDYTISTVEYAKNETRVNYSIKNNTNSVYENYYDSKINVDGDILEGDSSKEEMFDYNSPDDSSVAPNSTLNGTLYFAKIDYENVESIKYSDEGNFEGDYDTEFSTFDFIFK
jgi:hypothetical protein